ncbi:MAG: Asp-tRNA(Asn)/Glu-tRNA(Gln) amidotransferase subunit GatC [Patescibacteria group bacterium]
MQLSDIKNLAAMARLDMSEEEMMEMADQFDPILAYVGQVQEVTEMSDIEPSYVIENVMRNDAVTNTPGSYTEKILEQMPDSENGFLKVKQIL